MNFQKAIFAVMTEIRTTTVRTPLGEMMGTLEGGIRAFRGICYARCRRFRHSEPGKAWEGVLDATRPGTICPQNNCERLVVSRGEPPVMDEERLCLSVYAPEKAEGLPVMVWIHGGSYLHGGSEEQRYGCERLIRTGNVVAVKISYRLGALGYLYLGPDRCNFGLGDQILALEWVRDNIASFGGDPENVTLFGQSAGAHSIAAIISCCTGTPPFRRAILQSPPLGLVQNRAQAEKYGDIFRKRLGRDPEKAGLKDILAVQESMKKMNEGLPFSPVLDEGLDIPPSLPLFGISVLIGCTSHEASPMIEKATGLNINNIAGRILCGIWSRKIFVRPSREYADRLESEGLLGGRYHIRWHPEGSPLGSCHSIDLPFLLGEYDDWKEARMLCGMNREEYDRISGVFLKTWTDFARDGSFNDLDI